MLYNFFGKRENWVDEKTALFRHWSLLLSRTRRCNWWVCKSKKEATTIHRCAERKKSESISVKLFFYFWKSARTLSLKKTKYLVKTWKIYLDFGWSPNGCQKLCRCGTWHRSGNVVGMVVRELRGIFEQILLGLLECFYVLLCKHMYSRMYITYALVQIREQA